MLRASDLKIILPISTAIISAPDLDTILIKACEAVVELCTVSHSALVLSDRIFECGMVCAEHPPLRPRDEKLQKRDLPGEERLVRSHAPLIIPDLARSASLGSVREVVIKDQVGGSFSLDLLETVIPFTAERLNYAKF